MTLDRRIELAHVAGTELEVSRIGLGTWAIGSWMWGGTDEEESIKTIHAAVERDINLIVMAPAYGFGRSEEIVGRAIADLKSALTRRHRHQSRPRVAGWKGLPERQPRPDPARSDWLAAAIAH